MKKTCDIVLIVIILNLAIAGIANAQQDSRVYSDFKKIEIYMIKVWELVRQFNDPKAIEYMVLAKVEIDKARELLFRDVPRYLMARIHMTKAKQFTDLAARGKQYLDEDIDFDQQNNQSTIFTVELEYIF